jgi:hypothetical protein
LTEKIVPQEEIDIFFRHFGQPELEERSGIFST